MEVKPATATLSRPLRENICCEVMPQIYNSLSG